MFCMEEILKTACLKHNTAVSGQDTYGLSLLVHFDADTRLCRDDLFDITIGNIPYVQRVLPKLN